MHSDMRELRTENARLVKDVQTETDLRIKFEGLYNGNVEAVLQKDRELNAKSISIMNLKEKLNAVHKELTLKHAQLGEFESRANSVQDELDLAKYKLTDNKKDMSNLRLTAEVLTTTNESLVSEKTNLTAELRETRALYKSYEQKWSDSQDELKSVNGQYQDLKRRMLGHDVTERQQQEKIKEL